MALPDDEDDNTTQPANGDGGTPVPGGIISPPGTTDPNALLRQTTAELYKALQASNQPPQLPSLQRSPSDGTRPGLLGLLGEALSGGQSPLYHLSGQQEDMAGSRALMNFGINMMLASGPNRVKPNLFSAAAAGLQGAQQSMDQSQQAAYTQAGQQFAQQKDLADLQTQQQQNRIKTLQAALPLLTLQARTNMPSLYGGGPGTSGGPSAGAPGGGAPGGGVQFTGDPAKDLPAIAQHESGGDPTALNYVARADPSAYDRGATASGKYQIVNSTWREGMQLAGLDPGKYATAMSAPEAVQDQVAKALYGKYGSAPWDPSKFKQNWVPTPTGKFVLATGAAPPASGPGSAVRPYQIAGPANTPPPSGAPTGGLPTPPMPPPGAVPSPTDLVGPRPLPTTGPGSPVVTPTQIANTPVSTAPPGAIPTPAAAPPTAPAATPLIVPPPAAASPAAPPGPQTAPVRDLSTIKPTDMTLPEWQKYYRTAPTPDELQQRGVIQPANAPEFRSAQSDLAQAEAAAATARSAAQTAADEAQRGLVPQDQLARLMQASNDAEKTVEAARDKYTSLLHDTTKTDAAGLAAFNKEQDDRNAADYKAQVVDPRAAATLAQTELNKIQTTSDVQAGQKALEDVNNTRDPARETFNNVDLAKELSKLAGTSGFLQQWPQVSNFLVRNNLLTPQEVDQLGAQKSLDAVINKVVLSMRQGSGISRMTNFDLQFLQNTAPSSFTPEQYRPAMFATIQSAANRQLQYADMVNEFHASIDPQTGQPMAVWKAKELADQKLGPLVKSVPTVFPQGDPRAGQPMSYDDQGKWVLRNVNPGTFYTKPDGSLGIRGEPQPPQKGQQ